MALLLAGTEASAGGLGGIDLPVLDVVGLDRVASDGLLVERSPWPPAPQVLDALWKLTRGNPLALVELSSGLDADELAGRAPLPDDVRLGVALQHTLQLRADRLPESTRTMVLVAAAEGTGDLGLVLRAADLLGVDAAALEPAELAGLVRVADGRIDFPNPLMRTAVYQEPPSAGGRVCTVPGRLPGDEADADRRTWHRRPRPSDPTTRWPASSARRPAALGSAAACRRVRHPRAGRRPHRRPRRRRAAAGRGR